MAEGSAVERSHAVVVEMRPAEAKPVEVSAVAVASAVEMRSAEPVEVSAVAVAVEVSSGSESVESAPEAVKFVEPASVSAEAVTAVRVSRSERCSRGRAMSAVREVEACVSAAVPVCVESGAEACVPDGLGVAVEAAEMRSAEAVPAPAAVLVCAAAVFEASEAVVESAGSVVVVPVKIVPCVSHTFFLLAISVVFVRKAPVAKSVFVSVILVFLCFHTFYLRF